MTGHHLILLILIFGENSLLLVSNTTVALALTDKLIPSYTQSANLIIVTLRYIRQPCPTECLQCIQLESINMFATYSNSSSDLLSCSASARATAPVEVISHS